MIYLDFRIISQTCHQTMASIKPFVLDHIKAIWNWIFPISNIQMPIHPIPNPYPREHKYAPWPRYLDIQWGEGEDRDEIGQVAHYRDPREQVSTLHAAAFRNDMTAIYRFLAHQDPDIEDYRGQTPAYWAAYYGHVQALTILSIYGADLEHIDKRGKTPLRAAVKYDRLEAIDFLVSKGVDIHVKDGRGLTPIFLAAYRGNVKAYEKLLFYGADETEIDANGKTPRDILNQKCQEKYDHLFFFFKPFSSPHPSFCLKPYNIQKLADKMP